MQPRASRRDADRAPVHTVFACLLSLGASMVGGCYLSHGFDDTRRDAGTSRVDAGTPRVDAGSRPDAGPPPPPGDPPLVWVLVHPSDAPSGPGLYLFDETSQEVLRQLPLPDGVTSPHALAWDGTSLWLGGIDERPGVRELDPEDGSVRSMWPGVVTEGIATEGGRYWYTRVAGALGPLVEVTRDGTLVGTTELGERTVQDLVAADSTLYFLVNDGLDRIMRIEPSTGAVTEVTRGVDLAPYSLGFDGTYLVVAVRGVARRFDPSTGELVSESAFAVPGWITAIAYQ